MLTGIRDVDYKILNELDDKSLVNFCSVNKKADEYCDDQSFWLNRILIKFPFLPLNILKRYKKDKWSDYYIDLRRFEKYWSDTQIINDPMNTKLLIITGEQGRLDHIMILLTKKLSNKQKAHLYNGALRNNQLDIIKFLVSQKWNINFNFMLEDAVSLRYLDIVKYALENGADIHDRDDLTLRHALAKGYLNIAKYLIENGANSDYVLRVASEKGRLDIVKYLIENGANIHTLNNAPVELAYANGHIDIVDYLVSQGAPDPR